MKEQIFFHEGLSFDTRDTLKPPGYLQTCENVVFKKDGEQTLRPEFTAVNATAVGAVHSIARHGSNLIVGDGTHLRKIAL